MSALTITLIRIGFLGLLWLFVFLAIAVLRRDIYGTKVTPRRTVPTQAPQPALAGAGAPPAAQSRPVPAPSRPAPPPPLEALVVSDGPLTGTSVPLTAGAVRIGRAPANTLVLDDDYASSSHARIFREDGVWYLEDLNSTNGTFLGDQRIYGRVPLPYHVPIRIGHSTLELRR